MGEWIGVIGLLAAAFVAWAAASPAEVSLSGDPYEGDDAYGDDFPNGPKP
jgi:hypothetical protein